MIKNKRHIVYYILFGVVIIFSLFNKCIASPTDEKSAKISISVTAGSLIIGTNDSTLNIKGIMGNVATGRFETGAFWVNDQNGSTKYWTTISATDLISQSGDVIKKISAENIKLKRGNGPTLISGDSNPGLTINPQLSGYVQINNPTRYFSNSEGNGILGIYGDDPEISISIPHDVSFGCTVVDPCKFKGTITYTLYEE